MRKHEDVDKVELPQNRGDDSLPFVFAEEARHQLRYLPERDDERYPELFVWDYFDPETLGCFAEPLPDGVMLAYRTAMPEFARRPDLYRVGWHPHWKRICLFQKQRNRENDATVWGLAFVFLGEIPVDDKGKPRLPKDIEALNYNGRYDSFIGQMGEFYAPVKRGDWLELLEIADNQVKRKKGERAKLIEAHRQRPRAEKQRILDDRRHGALEHYKHLFCAVANQRDGAMNGLPIMSTDDEALAREKARKQVTHTVEDKGSYKVLTKRPLSSEGHSKFPEALEKRMPLHVRSQHVGAALVHDVLNKKGAPIPTTAKQQIIEHVTVAASKSK